MKKVKSGGGWQALRYTLRKAREVGPLRLYRAMSAKNACKTCALGMGGQLGGMKNEAGHFPEFCKKSLQAMAADMQGRIDERFFSTFSIDQMRTMTPRELETSGRIVEPMIAEPGKSHYRPIGWEEALSNVSEALKATDPERAFFYSSGRSSNEAGFILNLFARAFGSNHVNNCSYYCHQASGVGLAEAFGSGTATVELDDLDKCDLVFLIGGNPASNHPRLMSKLMEIRNRGGQVVVVNPIKETGLASFRVPSNPKSMLFGTQIASLYLQPKIGGDIALIAGITKWLIDNGHTDAGFIAASTTGFEDVKAYCAGLSWDEITVASGVARKDIEAAAEVYARSERAVFAWTMGITHHEHGVDNVRWISNLALLRGMVGKPGAGVLPIRGHSNVQGLGTIGVTPAIKKAALDGLESLGIRPAAHVGFDTLAALEAAGQGSMDFALCLGGNLFGASPDAAATAEALARIKTVVYLSTTLNTGHAHGLGQTTIVLPVLARDEEQQSTTQESMFSYVRLSDGGKPRQTGPRSEVDVLTDIANETTGTVGPLDWRKLKDHDQIRALIAKLVPQLDQIKDIGTTKKEFQIPDRVLHAPVFHTPNGKAAFGALPIPSAPSVREDELILMTIRSEGQFNTVVYEEEDIYRGQDRRDIIMMNQADIARLGFRSNQLVDVTSSTGAMHSVLVRELDIAPGCAAMYCPEANVLVPQKPDPKSRTPSFKAVVVRVSPAAGRSLIKLGAPRGS